MDKLLHLLAVLVAAIGHAPVAHPGVLTNGTQYDAGLATYGGVTAWWGSRDGEPGIAHLMVRTPKGTVKALDPLLSELAPTVDVGRGPDGRPLITYAQCGAKITSCRAYAYDVRTGRERPLGLGQAVAVAVDGSEVVWFREQREYGPSQLLVGSLAAPGGVARRVRLTKIDDDPAGAPLALELRGGRLAYAASDSSDDIRGEGLYAGTPDGLTAMDDGGSYGEECTRVIVAPTITPTALTWLRTISGTSSCGHRHGTLVRRAWADGALTHSEVPVKIPKEAVVTGDHVLALAPARTDRDQDGRDACNPSDMEESPGEVVGCVLRRLPAPRWRPGRGDE